MSTQLTHTETCFSTKSFPVILLLDNLTGEANIGSIFRLADAFGIEKIIFCGTQPNLASNRLKRTARNTHNYVDFEFYEEPLEIIKNLLTNGFKTIALEITSNSIAIENIDLNEHQKTLLIAGNERNGISKDVLELCETAHHINMFGENSSMNVAQSVGIALYEITKALNKFDKK